MLLALLLCCPAADVTATAVWRPVTVDVTADETFTEQGTPNPFDDAALTVVFRQGDREFEVHGYFAADGNAAETGAEEGRVFRAKFCPPTPGEWSYEATLAGQTESGTFAVAEAEAERGFHSSGPIVVDRDAQLYRTAGDGRLWLKGGAGSPENLLGYGDFDGTYRHAKENKRDGDTPLNTSDLHRYEPHAGDARPGDPTWGDGRGANLLGALNYLSGEGMNVVYFLTMNVGGDGKDVWPWTAHDERRRFDCSKLDQWDRVFTHMQRRGLAMHVLLQETENDHLLDGGELGPDRRLYLREIVARFAHHPGLIWNLGEENTQTAEQARAMAAYLRELDPYDHPIKLHTYPDKMEAGYRPLLGTDALDGVSLQVGKPKNVYDQTRQWLFESRAAGRPWTADLDEIGPADTGVKPDADDPDHDMVRREVLWPHLMAGGTGCEWYFGYQFAHHDLTAEDWRSRHEVWRQTRTALAVFGGLPLGRMTPAPGLAVLKGGDEAQTPRVLRAAGGPYVVYLPAVGPWTLDLSEETGPFEVRWVDPLGDGERVAGSVASVTGGGRVSPGLPPGSGTEVASGDWACVLTPTP